MGALGIFVVRRPTPTQFKAMLSFAAGVMLAAACFSLILPAIAYSRAHGAGILAATMTVALSVALGAILIAAVYRMIPTVAGSDAEARRKRGLWLFVLAITLHNFPEGIAVGVSFAGGVPSGTATAIGIGVQNIPEGLAVAFALLATGMGMGRAWCLALVSGLVEPVAGLGGAALISAALPLMPWALGASAGAMIYVVTTEILPEAFDGWARSPHLASATLLIGLGTMTALDVTLAA